MAIVRGREWLCATKTHTCSSKWFSFPAEGAWVQMLQPGCLPAHLKLWTVSPLSRDRVVRMLRKLVVTDWRLLFLRLFPNGRSPGLFLSVTCGFWVKLLVALAAALSASIHSRALWRVSARRRRTSWGKMTWKQESQPSWVSVWTERHTSTL